MKSLHFVRKALALVEKDKLLTIQKDSICCAGAQHRCSFSCSKSLSSAQDCSRSRDNPESENTVINLPGQSWLKASVYNKLWARLDYCGLERKGWKRDRESLSCCYWRSGWVQWGAEWEGKAAPPALPHTHLSCSSNYPSSSADGVGDGLQLFGHILPGVLDSHFDLPSAGLVPGNAWSN